MFCFKIKYAKKIKPSRNLPISTSSKINQNSDLFSWDRFSFKQKNPLQFGPKNKNREPYSGWKKIRLHLVQPRNHFGSVSGVETGKNGAQIFRVQRFFFSAWIQYLIRLARSDGKQIMLPSFLRSNVGEKLFGFLFVCVRNMEIWRNMYVKRFFFSIW